jgi:anti-sigma factor RsiW
MSCHDLKPTLIAFLLNAVEPTEREAVEAHLPGCPSCTGELVTLKRAVDLAEDAPRPSSAARARLRQAVQAELHPPPRPRRRWERPVAFTFAAVAALFALTAVRLVTSRPGGPPVNLPSTP